MFISPKVNTIGRLSRWFFKPFEKYESNWIISPNGFSAKKQFQKQTLEITSKSNLELGPSAIHPRKKSLISTPRVAQTISEKSSSNLPQDFFHKWPFWVACDCLRCIFLFSDWNWTVSEKELPEKSSVRRCSICWLRLSACEIRKPKENSNFQLSVRSPFFLVEKKWIRHFLD